MEHTRKAEAKKVNSQTKSSVATKAVDKVKKQFEEVDFDTVAKSNISTDARSKEVSAKLTPKRAVWLKRIQIALISTRHTAKALIPFMRMQTESFAYSPNLHISAVVRAPHSAVMSCEPVTMCLPSGATYSKVTLRLCLMSLRTTIAQLIIISSRFNSIHSTTRPCFLNAASS
eukprot:3579158-Pleurochrysis_carterae.AAC.1